MQHRSFLFILIFISVCCASLFPQKELSCQDFIAPFQKYQCAKDKKIAAGSVGSVFLLFEKNAKENLALLKVQMPRPNGDDQLQFIEGNLLAQVRHPNIISLYEKAMVGNRMIEILEYGAESTLDDFLRRNPTLRSNRIRMLQMFRQLASAVRFLHESGWVHADLKPSNIVVDHNWNLKLIDFDLVVPIRTTSRCRGTIGYRESGLNEVTSHGTFFFDEKVDVFSLGAIFYEMVTGQRLITGSTREQILHNTLNGNFVLKENTDVRIAYLIHKMLLPNRKKRYTMSKVANLIDYTLADSSVTFLSGDLVLTLREGSSSSFPTTFEGEVQGYAARTPQRYNFIFQKTNVQKVPIYSPIVVHEEHEGGSEIIVSKNQGSRFLVRLLALCGLVLVVFLTILVLCRAKKLGIFRSSAQNSRVYTQRTVVTRSTPVTTTRVAPVVVVQSAGPAPTTNTSRVVVREKVVVPTQQVVVRSHSPNTNATHTTTVHKEVVSGGKIISSTYKSTTQTRSYKS